MSKQEFPLIFILFKSLATVGWPCPSPSSCYHPPPSTSIMTSPSSPFMIVSNKMSVDEVSPRLTGVKSKFRVASDSPSDDHSMEIATPNKRALMTLDFHNHNNNVFNTSSGSISGLLNSTPLSTGNRMQRQVSMDCSFSSPIHGTSRSQDVPMMSPAATAHLSPPQVLLRNRYCNYECSVKIRH